jgi:hypothetical protein
MGSACQVLYALALLLSACSQSNPRAKHCMGVTVAYHLLNQYQLLKRGIFGDRWFWKGGTAQ